MIRVGIIGGGGYAAGELIRLLRRHPQVEITYVHSHSQSGKAVSDVHQDLIGECALTFTDQLSWEVEVLFLCMGHGQSRQFIEQQQPPEGIAIIDLSQDYRLDESFVYGLPELHRDAIAQSRRVANPGCFATAIQLGLLPLGRAGLLRDEVHIHAITGSTGAGQSPSPTTHFSWREGNVSVYKAFRHQHLKEVNRSLQQLQTGGIPTLNFLPLRGNFTRGIFASLYTRQEGAAAELQQLYEEYYRDHPFVHPLEANPSLKQVVNTNKCLLQVQKYDDKLLIISAIDNLLKGASGQAVQNMNLLFGLPEATGLQLKAIAF